MHIGLVLCGDFAPGAVACSFTPSFTSILLLLPKYRALHLTSLNFFQLILDNDCNLSRSF